MIYILAGLSVLMYLLIPTATGNGQMDWILLMMGGICALAWFLLSKVSLAFNDEGISYKTFFSSKEFSWSDITGSYIKYQHHGKSGSVYWIFTFAGNKDFKFSTSTYSRKSLRILASALVSKCDTATIQDKIYQIAEGRFPWYVF